MDYSFEEKSTWITAITIALVGAYYAVQASAGDPLAPIPTLELLFTVVVLIAVIEVVAHVAVAIATFSRTSEAEEADERDKSIAAKAGNIGGVILGIAVIGAIGHTLFGGAINHTTQICNPAGIARTVHILVLGLMAAELVSCTMRIYYYRRGF